MSNEKINALEAEIAVLKYHLSMINKLSLADADIDGYLDDIDIDSVLGEFDADEYDFDALMLNLTGN